MVGLVARVNAKGLVEVDIEANSIDEIVKAIPGAMALFSKHPEQVKPVKKQIPEWIANNIETWEKARERSKVVYAMLLMNDNKPILLEEIKSQAKDLGVNLDDWITHNFKRDMKSDVLEEARDGSKRSYKLSAVGMKKASMLRKTSK